MIRTQISLTEAERRALQIESTRTGRSMSALIREAIETAYAPERSIEDDLTAMRRGFGTWEDRDLDGAAWVDQVRTGTRLIPGL
ncbi:MAG TPA: CopG family transcriptional regulator [Solirubrobacteraceae bacterium]|jgi:plasmid stability protein|nr:CopG family transcriptional regulator [Solirubrobacteraceae bacterium]